MEGRWGGGGTSAAYPTLPPRGYGVPLFPIHGTISHPLAEPYGEFGQLNIHEKKREKKGKEKYSFTFMLPSSA